MIQFKSNCGGVSLSGSKVGGRNVCEDLKFEEKHDILRSLWRSEQQRCHVPDYYTIPAVAEWVTAA